MGQLDRDYLEFWAKDLSITEALHGALAQYDQQSRGDM